MLTLLYSRPRPQLPYSRHEAIPALRVAAPPALENAMLPIGIAAPVVAEKHANERNGRKMNVGLPAWQRTGARNAARRNAGRNTVKEASGNGRRTGRIELPLLNSLHPSNLRLQAVHSTALARP